VEALKKIFKGLFIGLDNGLFYLNAGLMSGLIILVIVSVLLRYIFNIAFNWTEELIVFVFIATTYFGIILGVKWDEHIKVSLLKDKLPPKIKIVFEIVITAITIITVAAAAYLSLGWISKVGAKISSGLKLHYSTVYYMLTVSFVMFAIYEIREIVLKIISFKKEIKKT
jgi:TRAP-type transport system small permease protein